MYLSLLVSASLYGLFTTFVPVCVTKSETSALAFFQYANALSLNYFVSLTVSITLCLVFFSLFLCQSQGPEILLNI